MNQARVEFEEAVAEHWTLASKARLGSYQHELSSGPWIELHSAATRVKNARAALSGDAAAGDVGDRG